MLCPSTKRVGAALKWWSRGRGRASRIPARGLPGPSAPCSEGFARAASLVGASACACCSAEKRRQPHAPPARPTASPAPVRRSPVSAGAGTIPAGPSAGPIAASLLGAGGEDGPALETRRAAPPPPSHPRSGKGSASDREDIKKEKKGQAWPRGKPTCGQEAGQDMHATAGAARGEAHRRSMADTTASSPRSAALMAGRPARPSSAPCGQSGGAPPPL